MRRAMGKRILWEDGRPAVAAFTPVRGWRRADGICGKITRGSGCLCFLRTWPANHTVVVDPSYRVV